MEQLTKKIATDFISNVTKTYKSDKTNRVSNHDFLLSIFGDKLSNDCPMLVSFKGNPADVNKGKWYGQPWSGKPNEIHEDANNYFSLARFRPNDAGEYRRKKAQFQGLHAVMLDDIGTKVPIERLTLEPNWLIETSPGNYQAGYILDVPITSAKAADQLMNAIVNAGLCDPGANGPTARLARLPVAINGKHEPPFPCKLESWAPDKRYPVKELINGLQLEIVESRRSKNHSRQTKNLEGTDEDQIWTPRPDENAVLSALQRNNIYKSPLGEGKHDITCPWLSEHTGGVDNGTAYFEPDDNYPLGGFKCLHGHCADRHIRDLLHNLEVDLQAARMKPIIRVVKGEINRILDAAERELATNSQYYQRGGLIVYVYTDPSTNEIRIQEITKPALTRVLSNIATWEQYDMRSKAWLRIDPPERHTGILYDSSTYRHLLPLKGLARQPYLRPDGTLVISAGYDPSTGMFGVFDSRKFSISDQPTFEEAKAALQTLNNLLDEFSFATETDRAAALSAMITAAIRPSLPHAPMFHVKAHIISSGKSYLCKLIASLATPQQGTPTTFPTEDEECRKLLLAELLKGPAVIEFDNVTHDIVPHKSLCTSLTSEQFSGRILGVSKTVTVSTRALFLSSGNNVGPIKDMTRRCITINLNPEVEIPAARSFKRPNLVNEVMQERECYVSAGLTIVRAWIVAGKPETKCKTLAGYGDWSDLCRQTLLWLGYNDPTASVFDAILEDPDREQLGRLLTAWQCVFGNTPAMVRDTVTKSTYSGDDNIELKEILHDIADERGEVNRRRLGWWIKRHQGQIVDNLRFARCSGKSSAEKWRVESVSSVLSVSSPQVEESVETEDNYRRASKGE